MIFFISSSVINKNFTDPLEKWEEKIENTNYKNPLHGISWKFEYKFLQFVKKKRKKEKKSL